MEIAAFVVSFEAPGHGASLTSGWNISL
jgi:hypothetical protein